MSLAILLAATASAVAPSTGTTGDTGGLFTGGSGATGDTGAPTSSGGSGYGYVDTAPPDTGDKVPHTGVCGCSSSGAGLGWLALPALLVLRRRR